MLETIPNISLDSISPYIVRDFAADSFEIFETGFTPFDFVPTVDGSIHFEVDSTAVESLNHGFSDGFLGVPLAFTSHVESAFFMFFAICFVFLSIVTKSEAHVFASRFTSVFSRKSQYRARFKEQITIYGAWINIFLVIQSVFVLSVSATYMLWLNRANFQIPFDNIYHLLLATYLGVLLFIVAKYILYRLIDYTFPDWGLQDWTSQYFTVVGLLGLFGYIPALLLVFAPELNIVAIILLVISLGITFLFSYRNLLIIFVKNNIGLLNYFLYLCAIEIVPLFLIYKGGIILANIAGKY